MCLTSRGIKNLVLAGAVALILALTIVPRNDHSIVELLPLRDVIDAISQRDLSLLLESILESVANVVLFVPFGAALAMRGMGVRRIAVAGGALSVAIETAQLLVVSGRTSSVSDVLLNTAGAVIGALTWRALAPGAAQPSGASP